MSEAAANTLQKVSEEFLTEVLAQLSEGRDTSVTLLDDAKKDTQTAVAKILEASTKQAASLKRQMIDSAELKARNMQLKALEDTVNEVFSEGVKRLPELSPLQREEALGRLVREGIQVIGQKARVSCNVADKKIVASVVRKLNKEGARLTMDPEAIQAIGGVTLAIQDGSIRFENTFEARLERMKQVLRKEIASTLYGSPSESVNAAGAPTHT